MSDPELTAAKRQILFYLSRRDHSARELTQKLKKRFEPNTVALAMAWAQEDRWLRDEQELAEVLVQQLQRQGKGKLRIHQILAQKGLPVPKTISQDEELESAQRALVRKLGSKERPVEKEEVEKLRLKMMRFLAQRGYTSEIIRKVIYEHFQS